MDMMLNADSGLDTAIAGELARRQSSQPSQPILQDNSSWIDSAIAQEQARRREIANPTPPSPDRGWVGDLGTSVARGVVGVGETGAKAYSGLGRAAKDFTGIELPGTQSADEAAQGIGQWRDETFPVSQQAKDSTTRNVITQGVESASTSMAPAIAGAAIGSAFGPVGTITGGLIGLFSGVPTFAASQYRDTMKQAEEKGIDPNTAKWTALVNAASEGGTELLSDVITAATGGTGKVLTAVGKDAIKAGISPLLKQGWKPMLANMGKVFGAEASTELLNTGIQAEANKAAGIDDKGFWDAVGEQAGPIGVASLIFSTVGGGLTLASRRRIENALTNPEVHPAEREAAAKAVSEHLVKIDPNAAKVWDAASGDAILNGRAIPLDEMSVDRRDKARSAFNDETGRIVERNQVAEEARRNDWYSPENVNTRYDQGLEDAKASGVAPFPGSMGETLGGDALSQTMQSAGVADKPEWQQAVAEAQAIANGGQGKPREVTPELQTGGSGGDDAYDQGQAFVANPDEMLARPGEETAAQAQQQTSPQRDAFAEENRQAMEEPIPQQLQEQPAAPKVLSRQEQKRVDDLSKRIENLTAILGMERNPAARARIEETRNGYEVERRNLTGETADVLTPEEQARANEVRQSPAALPAGQGFGLVGEPADYTQAEGRSLEDAAIPADQGGGSPDMSMPAKDSRAFDAGKDQTEDQIVRKYQEQRQRAAQQEYGAKPLSPLWNFLRGRLDAKSISDTFGPEVLESLRGKAPRDLLRSSSDLTEADRVAGKTRGQSWDLLEDEAKQSGLVAPDSSLIDTLMSNVTNKEQAQRDRVNGVNEVWQQDRETLPADGQHPEANEMTGLNSDGTTRDGSGPMYRRNTAEEASKLWDKIGTKSKYFKKWFGESKVVDDDGAPLVVKHATSEDFTKFNKKLLGNNTLGNASDWGYGQTSKVGFWFHDSGVANRMSADREMPVYLKIENPYETSLDDLAAMCERNSGGNNVRKLLKDRGYDGLKVNDEEFGGTSYVAFNPTQIKSAIGNKGLFSSKNSDIMYLQGLRTDSGAIHPDKAQAIVDRVREAFPEANLSLAHDEQGLHPLIRDAILNGDATAAYIDGKSTVYAPKMRSEADVLAASLHELAHQGIDNLRTVAAERLGSGVAIGQQNVNNVLDQAWTTRGTEIRALVKEGGPYEGQFDLTTKNGRRRLTEEWMATQSENPNHKWYDRYVAAMTRFFRNVANSLGLDIKWTDVETRDFLRQAMDTMRARPDHGMSGVMEPSYRQGGEGMYKRDVSQPRGSISFDNPESERRYREATKGIGDQRGAVAKVKDWLGEQKAGFTRHFIHMPNTPEFAEAHEALRQLEAAPTVAKEEAVRNLRKVTKNLSPSSYDLFSRKVILDDLAHEAELGHSLPFGFTPESLAKEREKINRTADNTAEVRDALVQRKAIMDDLTGRLVNAGILSADQIKNPAYFRHEVLEYAREWQQSQGAGGTLKTPKPGYAKGREGSEKDISANYLEVEYAFMQRAMVDLKTVETLDKIKGRYDIMPQVKASAQAANAKALASMGMDAAGMTETQKREALGSRYKDWSDMVPDGYGRFQADKGLVYHSGNAITDKAMLSLMDTLRMDDKAFQSRAPDVVIDLLNGVRQQLMVGGKKPEMVLPQGMVDTLNNLRPKREKSFFDQALSKPLGLWKQWVLINPRRVLKYNLNNMTGDLDAVIAGNPQSLKKLPEAIRELRYVMKGGEPSQDYRDAVARGVFDSGLSVQEIPDVAKLDAFQNLMADTRGQNSPLTWVRKGWRALQDYTQFRENWMRLAAYKDYLRRIEGGEDMRSIGYGAADPRIVDALSDPKDKAALLARSLVGDYGAVSHYGQSLRNKVIPFYSWMEVNAKRYNQLIMNAFDQGIGQGLKTGGLTATMLGARASAYLGVRMAAMYALIGAYNHLFHGEDEEKLSDLDRQQLHVILGHDKDGNIHTLRLQGALSDFLGWFGYADAVNAFKDVQSGRGSYSDVLKAVGKAPLNKVMGGLTPLLKTPLEFAMGQSTYPDVFNPRPMQDKGKEAARLFSAENEYDALLNKPTRGYWKSWLQAVDYSRNVGEISYNNTMDLVRQFKESKGVESAGYSSTPKSRLIREYKLAMRYGDTSATKAAMEKMQADGITRDDVDKSLLRSTPLSGLAQKERNEFMASLSPREQDQVMAAEQWYKDTFLDSDLLKSKYEYGKLSADYRSLHAQEKELSKRGDYAAAHKLKMDNDLYRKGNLVSMVEHIKRQRKMVADSRLPDDEKQRRLSNLDQRLKKEMDRAVQAVGQ